MNSNKNIFNVLIPIFAILLIVALVGFVFTFTNGLNEDLKTFYIEHNGKQIVASDSQMTFDTESKHRFDCKYISNPDNNSYKVKVVPNITDETDFAFTVNGNNYKWSHVKDLTSCFSIDKQNDYFIISFPADCSVQGILNTLYPEKNVIIKDTLPPYNYYFTLCVSSYNDKINYNIDFNVYDVESYIDTVNALNQEIYSLNVQISQLVSEKEYYESLSGDYSLQIQEINRDLNFYKETVAEFQEQLWATEAYLLKYTKYFDELAEQNIVLATFKVDGEIFATFYVEKGSTLPAFRYPSTEFYTFHGWEVDGQQITNGEFVIVENTVFNAIVDKYFTWTFMFNDEVFEEMSVRRGYYHRAPSDNPYLKNHTFIGWQDNYGVLHNENYIATEDMTFNAIFEENKLFIDFVVVPNPNATCSYNNDIYVTSSADYFTSDSSIELFIYSNSQEHSSTRFVFKYYRILPDGSIFEKDLANSWFDIEKTSTGSYKFSFTSDMPTMDVTSYWRVEISCNCSYVPGDDLWELE